MNEQRSKGCLIAVVVWCVILAALAAAFRYWVYPHFKKGQLERTSSPSQYKIEVKLAADSFSGYAVLRSERLQQELKTKQIRLTVQDDKADYAARVQALRSGKTQMAVFTVDSLLTACAKAGDFPGAIVLVLDETKGGDAIVAYRSAVPSIQELNSPAARFVLIPGSPGEFLSRVVLAHFNLSSLPEKWTVEADGAAAVLKAFRSASPTERKAFVLWEPYVSRALENPAAHVLIDSSKLRGYILDVLVAQRQFLLDQPETVRAILEAYARAAHAYSLEPDGLVKLVRADSSRSGDQELDEAQARKVVQGIQWKNTLENYAHFGLVPTSELGGLLPLEDIIGNIIDVLVQTRALPSDPLPGAHNTLYFNRFLTEMKASKFHPGLGTALLTGVDAPGQAPETIRSDRELPALTTNQWASLRPVGELRLAPIVFIRGSARISLDSERELQGLARRLQSFPRYYVRIVGHARAEGDPEANRFLAEERATAAAQFLATQGLTPNRLRTEASLPAAAGSEAQAVSFVVGQMPY